MDKGINIEEKTNEFIRASIEKLSDVTQVSALLEGQAINEQLLLEIIQTSKRYFNALIKIANLTDEELAFQEIASEVCKIEGIEDHSASSLDVMDVHQILSKFQIERLYENLISPNAMGEIYQSAVNDLAKRMQGGTDLHSQGLKPSDKDPRFDNVIYGHVMNLKYPEIIHFIITHYIVRMFRVLFLEDKNPEVRKLAESKDALINAIGDIILINATKTNYRYWKDLLKIWITPKGEGGLGWIDPRKPRIYQSLVV